MPGASRSLSPEDSRVSGMWPREAGDVETVEVRQSRKGIGEMGYKERERRPPQCRSKISPALDLLGGRVWIMRESIRARLVRIYAKNVLEN